MKLASGTISSRVVVLLLYWLALLPVSAVSASVADRVDPGRSASFRGATLAADSPELVFTIESGVSDTDSNDIIEGARLGMTIIGGFIGYDGLTDIEIVARANAAFHNPNVLATTRGQRIEVFTGGQSWQVAPALVRIETMVHELMHVYQNAHEGDSFFSVPIWFDEGTAEALGYLAISQLGVVDQADIYDLTLFQLTRRPVGGSLAALTPYGSMTADSYPLAYIAVQYLLGRAGLSVSALAPVYDELNRGTTFASAFAQVFGQPLDDFYVDFDRWRTGLMRVTTFPLEFVTPHWDPGPSPAHWAHVQEQVERGSQLLLVVSTEPGAACMVQLPIADDRIERRTTASGNGSALWLITIPDRTPSGTVSARASCGDAFISQDIAVL